MVFRNICLRSYSKMVVGQSHYSVSKEILSCQTSVVDIKGHYNNSRFWLPDNRNRDHANRAGSYVRMWSSYVFSEWIKKGYFLPFPLPCRFIPRHSLL